MWKYRVTEHIFLKSIEKRRICKSDLSRSYHHSAFYPCLRNKIRDSFLRLRLKLNYLNPISPLKNAPTSATVFFQLEFYHAFLRLIQADCLLIAAHPKYIGCSNLCRH